jgi:hypothetical protein
MWIKACLIAVGFVAATAAATPSPTLAQGVYVGPGGVSVDVGVGMTIMPMTGATGAAGR